MAQKQGSIDEELDASDQSATSEDYWLGSAIRSEKQKMEVLLVANRLRQSSQPRLIFKQINRSSNMVCDASRALASVKPSRKHNVETDKYMKTTHTNIYGLKQCKGELLIRALGLQVKEYLRVSKAGWQLGGSDAIVGTRSQKNNPHFTARGRPGRLGAKRDPRKVTDSRLRGNCNIRIERLAM